MIVGELGDRMATAPTREVGLQCPNCELIATGDFCPRCGQPREELVPSLRSWLSDVLDDLFFVNRRVPDSLRLLATRPGELTREWRLGRRARYVHPFRIYLLCASASFVLTPFLSSDEGLLASAVAGFLEARVATNLDNDALLSTLLSWWPRVVLVVMVPLAACILAFVTRGKRLFLEHLVFSLHFHSVVFLYGLIGALLSLLPDASLTTWLTALPFVATLVYAALAIRRNYAFGMGRTLVVTLGGLVVYFVAFVLTLGVVDGLL